MCYHFISLISFGIQRKMFWGQNNSIRLHSVAYISPHEEIYTKRGILSFIFYHVDLLYLFFDFYVATVACNGYIFYYLVVCIYIVYQLAQHFHLFFARVLIYLYNCKMMLYLERNWYNPAKKQKKVSITARCYEWKTNFYLRFALCGKKQMLLKRVSDHNF